MTAMGSRAKEGKGNSCVSLVEQAPDIHKAGYLKKLKTMRKKFFVMRRESAAGPARLECYDSEKKWKCGALPKRSVTLRTCFNINRRADAKQRHVLALYTRDDTLALVADSEEEREAWLTELLRLQHGGSLDAEARPKPLFEHVWQVNVKTKGLGSSRNIAGAHRLCLTAKALSLVKMPSSEQEEPETLEFPLMSIRRCGHSDCFFFMELGRSSVTGSGELWMQTEDTVIAQNMHETILGAMKSSRNKEELGPLSRPRSSSTSENSRPISHKRPSHLMNQGLPSQASCSSASCHERCDSMPSSRSRNTSESHLDSSMHGSDMGAQSHVSYGRLYSTSPPSNMVVGSYDSTCSNPSTDDSDGQAEYFSRYSHSLPMDILAGPKEPTIKEEATSDDYLVMSSPVGHNSDMSAPHSQPSDMCEYLKMSMSPTSSIPETADGYIPMSPMGSMSLSSSLERGAVASASTDTGYLNMEPQGSTRATSVIAAATPTPARTTEGYMDMAPLSSSLPKSVGESCTDFSDSWCSAHSLQDVPSSTSPMSASLEGFHLDKVKSYFSPSEDDSEDYIKPARAYSIGSRQQVQKSHLSAHLDQSRVRAYSVGSQAPSAALRRRRQKEAEADAGSLRSSDSGTSKKSSSVPLLPEATAETGFLITSVPQHCDYSEDLMEINYDKHHPTVTMEDECKACTAAPTTSAVTSKEPAGKHALGTSPGSVPKGSGAAEPDYAYVPMGGEEKKSPFPDGNYLPFLSRSMAGNGDGATNGDSGGETGLETPATHMSKGGGSIWAIPVPSELGRGASSTSPSASPAESSQLGEYVNLDLGKTWKWTQPIVTPAEGRARRTADMRKWAVRPVGDPVGVAPLASVAEMFDPALDPLPPGASYENVSLGDALPAERVLNYASLDLAPPTGACSEEGNGTHQRSPRSQPVAGPNEGAAFVYAEIDFTKSEGLRNISDTLREGRL